MAQARYLDIHELAEVLDISASSIRRRLRSEPWKLPPSAQLGPDFPLRWREYEVRIWMVEQGR
jgi:predicted DNA-binding transcriptional regulator AlpA